MTIQTPPGKIQFSPPVYQDNLDENPAANVTVWYDTLSPGYDELYASEQKPKHDKILEHLGPQSFRALLDIGCGTGTFLTRAERLYDYAIGIDLSKGMLKIARTRRSSKQDLVQAALPFLPIKNASIDCIVSISTSKGDRTLPLFIGEIDRVSRDNSTLALTILEPREQDNQPSLGKPECMYKISNRETLYITRIKPPVRSRS